MTIDLEQIVFIALKAGAVITISEDCVTIVPETPDQKQPEEPEPKPADKPKASKKSVRRVDLDMGKVRALRNAGWSFDKIADEMGCSPQTIVNHLKAEEE